mmetsp:Transcript_31875/g.101539  ORF Transcript_31875/g.101539 Transcript_31875/m.101539 type:complete len:158 (-) Transcript_31875:187-660(-)
MAPNYDDSVTLAIGTLAAKQVLVQFLKVRARMASGTFDNQTAGDWPLKPIFKASTIPVGPLTSKEHVDRIGICERNNCENEPFFLLAALAYGKVAAKKVLGANLVLAYCACRTIHNGVTIVLSDKKQQPWRGALWATNAIISGIIGGTVFLKKIKAL